MGIDVPADPAKGAGSGEAGALGSARRGIDVQTNRPGEPGALVAAEATPATGSAVDNDSARLAHLLLGELQEILRVLAASTVEEFRLEHDGKRIALRRQWPPVAVTAPSASPAAAPAPVAPPEPQAPAEATAHLVGVFHRSREPGGPNLVEPGARVESGQAIGVIETLGMASTVEAPVAGTVVELLVEDGQPVEYGQVVARILPD